MKRTEIKAALAMQELENEINVKGWVRNKRGSKNVAFIALNDGSTINNLQLVIALEAFNARMQADMSVRSPSSSVTLSRMFRYSSRQTVGVLRRAMNPYTLYPSFSSHSAR